VIVTPHEGDRDNTGKDHLTLYCEATPMGQAELISLDHMRATHHLSQLRQRLHECFDQWLDTLESYLDDKPMSLPDLTAVMGQLRQDLMGSLIVKEFAFFRCPEVPVLLG
jgi:hypothetical protein